MTMADDGHRPVSGGEQLRVCAAGLSVLRISTQREARISHTDGQYRAERPGMAGRLLSDDQVAIIPSLIAAGLIAVAGDSAHLAITKSGRRFVRRALLERSVERGRGKNPPDRDPGGEGSPGMPAVPPRPSRPATECHAGPQPAASESVLTWLRRRRDRDGEPLITAEQFTAGERLTADFFYAGMVARTTANWGLSLPPDRSQRGAGATRTNVSDAALDARERVRRALAAVGPEFAGLLIEVCGYGRGLEEVERSATLPQRSARIALLYALNALARHYGLIPAEGCHWPGRGGIRRWGSADYRPSFDDPNA